MIDVVVVFYFWIEQRWNGSSISRPGLVETLEVPNVILEGNSLNFRWSDKWLPTVSD
jgi:hypothetical protein